MDKLSHRQCSNKIHALFLIRYTIDVLVKKVPEALTLHVDGALACPSLSPCTIIICVKYKCYCRNAHRIRVWHTFVGNERMLHGFCFI